MIRPALSLAAVLALGAAVAILPACGNLPLTAAPGWYPNCRQGETGFSCDAIVDDGICDCTGAYKTRHVGGAPCGVNTVGAEIRFTNYLEQKGEKLIGTVNCQPIQAGDPGGMPNDFGGPQCSPCMAAKCTGDYNACGADELCSHLDICLRTQPLDACLATWGDLDSDPVAVGYFACAGKSCAVECSGASGCPATCGQ